MDACWNVEGLEGPRSTKDVGLGVGMVGESRMSDRQKPSRRRLLQSAGARRGAGGTPARIGQAADAGVTARRRATWSRRGDSALRRR